MSTKRLIALAGRAGSGKNTVATMLGGAEVSFAYPLKRFVQQVFAFTDEQVWGPSEARNRPDPRYPRPHGPWVDEQCACCGLWASDPASRQCHLTPRLALQMLGTDWGRVLYRGVWAGLGVRRALELCVPLAVLTDCRFINEARAVREAGGEVWRVVRPGAGLAGAAALHPSEAEQESPEFLSLVTRTIDNAGTLEDLRREVANG